MTADDDGWSSVAAEWSRSWGAVAAPVWTALVPAAGVGPGCRVLDVGCGSGEFLADLVARGAEVRGVDASPAMVELARTAAPAADVRTGDLDELPWPSSTVDVVTAVNALHFADDPVAALTGFARVCVPGGRVAVATWAERSGNDLDTLDAALAAHYEEDPEPDGELRVPGGLEAAFSAAGLDVLAAGTVDVPFVAADDDALVRAVLLGEDEETVARTAGVVLEAARPFRTADGGYLLAGVFRWVVGRS